MARVDLEEIAHDCDAVTLALIARIRELEFALYGCGDYSRYGDRIRSVLEKGVVLP